ncbi:MAG TPA: purine-nucleoside phosphorylase [Candidatus Glassbacteria bacterium]|nr:purine-nucleoside phosphorylase [Candidatus Glassbacteria bacterium]
MTATDLHGMIREAAEKIRERSSTTPGIGIILGTGLGGLAARIDIETEIPYPQIPYFVSSTVETHQGRLLIGTLSGRKVVAMQGRFHFYEGYSMGQITFPVRVMKELGASVLIVSNACGGMNPQFSRGDLMLIEDHINLLGANPLIGPNDERLGPRFPDMCQPYSRRLIALAERVALQDRIPLQKGVYVAVVGPNLETRAEYRFLRGIGADVVGMSTVPEVIAAVHCGLEVLGVSIVTDLCFPECLEPADISDIIRVAGEAEPKLTSLISKVVGAL